ncbi:hypothetical protein ABEB36_013709 [Hypothenemus hampei]|uniref:THAP-type domain-containing protein n=1 Tax=Hypothenemus hampei TaxID=57062 RepID=A0ABD1E5Y4_HYPHA
MEFTGKSDIKDNSRICEFHFAECQFEAKREDGRRLLKPNAIPDLLNKENCPCVSVIHKDKPRQESKMIETESSSKNPHCGLFSAIQHEYNDELSNTADNCSSEIEDLLTNNSSNDQQLIKNLRASLKKVARERNKYKKDLENMREGLQNIYNDDQLKYIKNRNARGQLWSENTMTKAIKLYLACGTRGYEKFAFPKSPNNSTSTS